MEPTYNEIRHETTLHEQKLKIENDFIGIHARAGYDQILEVPPYPSPDNTVLFVGAQISLWKPELDKIASGDVLPNFSAQNCIRLQNKEIMLNKEPMFYNSFFRAHGAVAPAEDFQSMIALAEEYLELIGVSSERIVIKTDEHLKELFITTKEEYINTERVSYYHWTYGEPDLTGHGLTFAIKNESQDCHNDIGNVIVISRDGIPLVCEWGFGEETLLNAVNSGIKPIYYSDMPDRMRQTLCDFSSEKYVDAMITAVRMASYGVRPGERGEGAMLTEYLRAAAYIAVDSLNKGHLEPQEDLLVVSEYFNVPQNIYVSIADRFEYYIGRINYVRTLARDNIELPHSITTKLGVPVEMAKLLINEFTEDS